jgi:hypothetical protein
MKPVYHANLSVKKYGGDRKDYLPIHNFIDSSKSAYADSRHRAVLHSTFGIFLVEQVFGEIIINSNGKEICTRDIAEDHVIQDLGFIPTVEKWLESLQLAPWMMGDRVASAKTKTVIKFD